jgi:hypothetical protein
MVDKEYIKSAGVYKVQTFGTTHFSTRKETFIFSHLGGSKSHRQGRSSITGHFTGSNCRKKFEGCA